MSFNVGLIGNRAHQMSYGPVLEGREDCTIVAAAEHNAEKAKPLEDRFGVVCSDDYDSVLENPEVDFVSIATDFYLKLPLIKKAVACGKHVLVDKPISRTVVEARGIFEAVQGSDIKLVLSYPIRFLAGLSWLIRSLKSGEYKNLTSYSHHFVRQFKDSDLMQYVSYPTPLRVNGGGELMNLGSHAVDLAHHLFGLPQRVFAHMENAYWPEYEEFGTEDMTTLVLEYESLAATIVTGRNKIQGKEGPSVNAVDVTAQGCWMRAELDSAFLNGEPVELEAPDLGISESCVQELIDCIEEDRAPVMGVADGLGVAQITTAAYQSAKSGEFVDLPLEDENHPGIAPEEQVIDGYLD
jgi:UDP-N-acetyl-2-amino-2-deoxyglucuronate dehydrogenase